VQTFETLIRHEYQSGVRPAPRDAHPKGHGCVKGSFTVRDGLQQLRQNLTIEHYEAGHMAYIDAASLAKLKADLDRWHDGT
jgi:carboxypeptidase C (cathepsin A)